MFIWNYIDNSCVLFTGLVWFLSIYKVDSEILSIPFPSFIRRVGGEKAKQLKEIALEYQCNLKRVRRSRNWQLNGKANQLGLFMQSLKGCELVDDYPFIAEKIREALLPYIQASLPERLAELVTADPTITLAELMEKTGCTIAQARLAREEAEF